MKQRAIKGGMPVLKKKKSRRKGSRWNKIGVMKVSVEAEWWGRGSLCTYSIFLYPWTFPLRKKIVKGKSMHIVSKGWVLRIWWVMLGEHKSHTSTWTPTNRAQLLRVRNAELSNARWNQTVGKGKQWGWSILLALGARTREEWRRDQGTLNPKGRELEGNWLASNIARRVRGRSWGVRQAVGQWTSL